jgi:hypothetical protein
MTIAHEDNILTIINVDALLWLSVMSGLTVDALTNSVKLGQLR